MMNLNYKIKRMLALILMLSMLLSCAPALAESYAAIVGGADLPVYKDAAMQQKVTELEAYTLVTVKAVKGDVAQLKVQGYTVYAERSGLKKVDDIAIPGVVSQDTRVFEEPDLISRSTAVKKGTELNVLMISGNWAMVEKNGKLGYTYVDHLSPAASATPAPEKEESDQDPFLPGATDEDAVTIETIGATVNVAKLPVYKSASTASKKLLCYIRQFFIRDQGNFKKCGTTAGYQK